MDGELATVTRSHRRSCGDRENALLTHRRVGAPPAELVSSGLRVAHQVPDREPPGAEGVGDEQAMAPPGHGLTAHDRQPALDGHRDEVVDGLPVRRAQRVVGVVLEADVQPGGVDGRVHRLAGAPTSELGYMYVVDARIGQPEGHVVAAEVRATPGAGLGAHVGDQLDPVFVQRVDERGFRTRPVPDRPDIGLFDRVGEGIPLLFPRDSGPLSFPLLWPAPSITATAGSISVAPGGTVLSDPRDGDSHGTTEPPVAAGPCARHRVRYEHSHRSAIH